MKLIIDNSYSQIEGLDSKNMNALRQILSYDIDKSAAYFSNNRFNTKKYLIDKQGFFPSGLLKLVLKFISQNALKCPITDLRVKPLKQVPLKATFKHKPYKAQQEALDQAIQHERGTLAMATGSGKSLVMAMIINALKVKTLVVVPSLGIKQQLIEDFEGIFGKTKHITVLNIDSPELMKDTHYDLLLIDESHHAGAATYQKLNKAKWNKIFYRYFLTATPYRGNTDENILFEALAGDVIYKLSCKQAIAEGYIVPVEAYYIEIPAMKTEAYTWQEVYKELVTEHQVRNEMIADLINSFVDAGVSTMCLVKEIKHGEAIQALTGLPFINGKDDETRPLIAEFSYGKITGVIATTGVCGEGINTKKCEVVIIAGLGKAKGAFLQQVGRAIRTYPGKETAKIILIKDSSHKFVLRHFQSQCKILKEEFGIIPTKL